MNLSKYNLKTYQFYFFVSLYLFKFALLIYAMYNILLNNVCSGYYLQKLKTKADSYFFHLGSIKRYYYHAYK